MEKIVTRFPPSPTGYLQAGNVRTALFNYLFARQSQGKFLVRIEDTDRERSRKEFEDNILDCLQWLGFEHDAFYRQTDHIERYKEMLSRLIDKDLAYISKEVPAEEGQRTEVIRFRNPNEKVTFIDLIRGDITIDTTDLGDFIIGRSITEPLYHFGVVVDDFDEGVTHVIRGEDHISNTPRQILILRALGGSLPVYAHLPLLMGTDRKKLSKRRGAKAITEYRSEGFIPEGVINYLALLGWHPEGEQEIFSLAELLEQFDLARIQKGAAIFDEVKMRWFNHQHLRRLTCEEYTNRLRLFMGTRSEASPRYLEAIAPLLQERAETLGDAAELLKNGEFSFMENSIAADPALLIKGAKTSAAEARKNLTDVETLLDSVSLGAWDAEHIKTSLMGFAEERGKAAVLWPLRVALSGKERSPDPFTIGALIGKKETLERIEQAIKSLRAEAGV